MLKVHHNMAERKNFLLLAIGMGVIGIIIANIIPVVNNDVSMKNKIGSHIIL